MYLFLQNFLVPSDFQDFIDTAQMILKGKSLQDTEVLADHFMYVYIPNVQFEGCFKILLSLFYLKSSNKS